MWYCTGDLVSCRVSPIGCICCLVEGWLRQAAARMDLRERVERDQVTLKDLEEVET